MNWEKEKENLEDLILNKNLSYEEIGRLYTCSGNWIKKIAKKLNIQLIPRRKINNKETFNKDKRFIKVCKNCEKEYISHPKRKSNFCCRECYNKYKHKYKYLNYLENQDLYLGKTNMHWIKTHILEEQNYRCAICKCKNTWNNKDLIFILDHIDGHSNNNRRDNLRLICPNCDSQLETYKSKNKNSDRVYYHYHHR